MPILTTSLMRALMPQTLAGAQTTGEFGHAPARCQHLRHDIGASRERRAGVAQRYVQRGVVLGVVDVRAGEHAPDALRHVALLRQRAQQLQRLRVQALLGEIVEQTLERQAERFGPLRIIREEPAQRFAGQRLAMRFKIPPCLRTCERHELSP